LEAERWWLCLEASERSSGVGYRMTAMVIVVVAE